MVNDVIEINSQNIKMSVELTNDVLNITVKDTEYSLSLVGSTLTSWKVNGNELIFNR
jgi:D-hexose-6-phosphate mutarotase